MRHLHHKYENEQACGQNHFGVTGLPRFVYVHVLKDLVMNVLMSEMDVGDSEMDVKRTK